MSVTHLLYDAVWLVACECQAVQSIVLLQVRDRYDMISHDDERIARQISTQPANNSHSKKVRKKEIVCCFFFQT